MRQWSTLHPKFSFLPQEVKFAISGSPQDRAAVQVHDIGLVLKHDASGTAGFEVIVGGGQGRTPMIGKTIRGFLPKKDLLSYAEAILRVYNRFGRRDNKYKARIKILVHELDSDALTDAVEREWYDIRDGALRLPATDIARIGDYFAAPAFEAFEGDEPLLAELRAKDRAFDLWAQRNVVPRRSPGYAIVNISLKPIGGVPGDATTAQMDSVADIAEQFEFGDIRVSHTQNLVLPHIRHADLYEIWGLLADAELATGNIGLVTDIIACPVLDFCSLANARSIPISQRISERFATLERQHDIGELAVKISGCINAFGHHHVGHIGILSVDRKGEEYCQITLGGNPESDTSIGKFVGPAFWSADIVNAVETVADTYLNERHSGERLIETYNRLSKASFKEALYGTA